MHTYGNVYTHFISKIKFQVSGLVFSEGGGEGSTLYRHTLASVYVGVRLCL